MKRIALLFIGLIVGLNIHSQVSEDTVTILSGEFFDFETQTIDSTEDVNADFAFVQNFGAHLGNEGTTLPGFRLYYGGKGSLDTIIQSYEWAPAPPWISNSYDLDYGTGETPLGPGDLFYVFTSDSAYGVIEVIDTDSSSFIQFAYKYSLPASGIPAILHISVDMNYYISQGIFDPAVDYVDLPNSVETWNEFALPPMEDPDSNGIYEYSLDGILIGDLVEFKARMNGSWSEPHDFPSGDNRVHTIETPSDSLYFWFNDEMPIADWSEFQTGAEHVIDVEVNYPEKSDTTSTQAYLLFWYGNWDINADGYVAFPHRPDGKVPFNVPAFGAATSVPAYIPVDGNPDVTFLAAWDPDPNYIGENMRAYSQDTIFPLIEEGYDDIFGTPLVIENIDTSYVPPQIGFSDIWYTNEQMTIDGDTSESTWDAIPRNFINKLQMGTVDDSLDLSGFWKASWDTENLYVLVDVTDQTKFNYGEGSGTSWENDNVELYFDLYNDKTGAVADDIDNIQYRFSWNLTEQEGYNAIWDGVEFGQVDKTDGYILEIKIPWYAIRHEVFFELTNGNILGFDVVLSDNEGSGREAVMNWSNTNSNWLDLSGIGDIQFSGRPPADVEFNVDMRVPLIDSTLDPAIDFVDVAGSFNEWGSFIDTLYDPDGDSIYSTTLYGLHAGNTIEYKFRINGSWDHGFHELQDEPNRAHLLHDGLNVLHHIYDDQLPYDIAVRRIVSPKTMAGLGTSEVVELELENTGALPMDGIDVYYQINGGSIVSETITDTLYPAEPFIYSFAQSADLSAEDTYEFKAWIGHPGDEDARNDTLYQNILHLPIISSYPYFEDFETDEGFWSAQPLQGPLTWEWGMPVSGMGLSIDAAASGSNCWVTNLSGEHGDMEKSYVMSPVFDLSNMTLPYVSFSKKSAVDYASGASNLQVSIDTGQTWYTVGRFEQDTNWYDIENFGPLWTFRSYRHGWSGYDSAWVHVAHHVKAMAGKPYVMFRITFATDDPPVSEGFAFDDFVVYEGAPQYNIGITNVQIDEGSECYPGNSENVHVDITNQGLEPVADYDVTLFVDDQETAMEFISDTLYPFDTLHYTFSAKADLYTTEFKRNYKLEVFAGLPSDGFMPDDNYIRNIEVFGDYMVQPGYTFYNTCNSGLNENNVWSMLQGDDGDIWFTGFRGISRFDGSNWTHYTTEDGLAYDYSWASIKASNGDLWFLGAGVPQATVYDGTNFSIIDLPDTFDECAYEDDAGNLWFGSYTGAGALKYDGSSFIQYGHDQLGMGTVVLSIAQNVNGNILVATDHGMVEFDGSKWNEMLLNGNTINASEIFTGETGNLWMAANNNFYAYDGEEWYETMQINNIQNLYAEDIKQDSLGNVWFAGGYHVYKKNNDGIWQVYSKETGLIPDHYFYSLLMANDTTVWAGSYRGGAVNFDPDMPDTFPYKIITDNDLTGNATWYADTTYILDGVVYLETDTLTIEPGTVIKGKYMPGNEDNTSMLVIARDAMIDAQGTPEAPIVFTSEFDPMDGTADIMSRGLWGGLYILGNGMMNTAAGEGQIEGLPDARALYGGSDDTDNSGNLQFVSIRHGGAYIDNNMESNGLFLGAVGDQTVIDHIEILSNADDGFEAIGGMPHFSHVLVAYPGDDAFDTDGGFRGKGQFLAAVQAPNTGDNLGEHDGGIENDTDLPESHFQFSNTTYFGNGFGDNNRMLYIRDYAAPEYYNSIFVSQDRGVMIEHLSGTGDSYEQWLNGNLIVANSIFNSVADDTDYGIFQLEDPEMDATQGDIDAWAADFYNQNNEISDPGISPEYPLPAGNVEGADYSALDPWFKPAEYRGAFSPDGNWAGSWSRMYQHEPYHEDIIIPRGQNWSQSLDSAMEHQIEVYVEYPEWDSTYEDSTYLVFYYGNVDLNMVDKEPHGYVPFNMPDSGSTYVNAYVPVNGFSEVTFTARWNEDGVLVEDMDAFGDTLVEPIFEGGYTFIDYPGIELVFEPFEDTYVREYYDGQDSLYAIVQLTGYLKADSFLIGTAYHPDTLKSNISFGEYDYFEATADSGNIFFYGDAGSPCGTGMGEYIYMKDTITNGLYFELLSDTCLQRIDILDMQWFEYIQGDCPPGYHYDYNIDDCVRDIILDDPSLTAFFPFDGDVVEATGTGIAGTLFGPTLATDRFGMGGKAFYYNGFGDYALIGNDLQLINNSSHFTISAWIKPNSLTEWQNTILGEREPNGHNYQFAVIDHSIYFSLWDQGTEHMFTGNPGTIMENEWQMVTVTSDGSNVRLYWNDMLDNEFPGTYVPDGHPSDLYLGTWDGFSDMFDGEIDDVRFYNRALTQEEITQLVYEGGFEPVWPEIPESADAIFTEDTIVIDGFSDEPVWDTIPANMISKVEAGEVMDSLDLSGYWKAVWNVEHLIILVDIYDEAKYNLGPGYESPWENDNVELFFDLFNNKNGAVPDEFDNKQYRFIWDLNELTGHNVNWDGVEYAQANRADGYTFEIRLPWYSLNEVDVPVMNGTTLGFDVSVNDNDDGISREATVNWSNPGSNWEDLSMIGDLNLTGMPPAEVTFELNMSYQAEIGNFDPGSEFVDLAGTFTNWGSDPIMLADPDKDSIYSATIELSRGSYIEYKYRINGDWNTAEFPGGENRMYTIMDSSVVIHDWYNDEFPYDVGLISLISPAAGCGLTNSEVISVEIQNNGNEPISGFEITYQLDSNASVTEIFADTLAPFTNMIYDFSQPADISTLGFHEIYLEVYHPEDAHPDNNHLYHELYNTESVLVTDAQPYLEDFEGDQSWSSYGQNDSWMLGTPTHGAINGSYSWSTNLTGNYNDEEYSFVESPCFNLSDLVVPVIDFNMDYILEDCCDGVELQYSDDGGNSWYPLHFEGHTDEKQGYWNEYGWSGNSYGIINIRKPATFLGGESSVKFRFKLQSDGSVNERGFTFDDFQIYEGALDYDISLTGIFNPQPGCGLSSSEEVMVGLVNKGKNPATDITLAFSRDSFNTIDVSEMITDTLYPGEMIDYTFNSRADLSIFRQYDFGVHVNYEEDLNPADNIIMVPISNKPSHAIDSLNPYFEGFEGINFWTTGGHNPSWEQGIPRGLVINQPAEGSYVMATNLSGKYNTDEDSYIESQCFDFTNTVSPQILFSLWTRTEECCDMLSLWYTTDNGQDWYKIGDDSQPFWYNNYDGFSGNTGGWKTMVHNLDFLAGEPKVRFRFVFNSNGSFEKEGVAIDDLHIYDKPAYDVSITALYLPRQSCDYPDNQFIEVGVSSLGRNAASGFDVGYQVDNNAPVIETVSETVFRDVEYNHLFGTNADLSADGMHVIKVWTDHPSDGIRDNDTLVYQVLNKPTINTYPYVESFEDGPGYWTSSKFEGLYTSWELGVPNGNQIKNASDGNRAWVTNLDGPYADNEVTYVESPCFDLSSLASPVLSVDIFSDNNYYDDGAIVQYSPDDGMNWYYLDHAGAIDNWYNDFSDAIYYNSDGSDAWTGNDPWRTAVRGISELAGDSIVKFRILFASYENYNNYEGFAFDNFRVYEKSASDAGVTEIYEPLTNCGLDTAYVTVDIKNFGDNVIDSIPVSYQLNNQAPVTEYYLGLVNPGDFFEFSFSTAMDISTVGTYHLKVWTSLENDSVLLNDTLRHAFENQNVHLVEPATPLVEDFESGQGGWHVEGDNPSWQFGQPANDYISEASSGSNAWVSALTMDYNDNEFSYLYSPCFDLSLMNAPVIEFQTIYEMESCCDGVMLEYSVDGGYSWQSLGTENEMGLSTRNWFVNYLGWTGNSGGWQNSMRISPELANEPIVKFRLKLESDGGYTEEGFGFDDFKIYTLPEYDIRLHSVISPQSGSMLTNNEFFEVRIANEGEKDIHSFSVGYQLETSSQRVQQFDISIPSQSTRSVLLDQIPVDLSVIGDYRFKVWVSTPDDSLHQNDTIRDHIVYRKPVIHDYPYSEDFENGRAFWHAYGTNSSWEHGVPSGQVINTASSGDNAWVTNLTGEYNNGEVAFVEGPAFDLSDLVLPVIELKIFRDLPEFVEGAAIQYSVDNGEWQYLGRKGEGLNWYNNDIISVYTMEEPVDGWTGNHPRWVLARHSLEPLSGEAHVKFRVVFTSMETDYDEFSGFEGFAFDDISIYESAKPYDLSPVAVHNPSPGSNCGLTGAEPVMISVKNRGLNAANGFNVSYQINGDSPVTESISQELLPGEVLDYEFTGLADLSLSGYYDLKVYTSYGNDQRRFNDTIFDYFLNRPVIAMSDTGIYSEDFESGENGWIAGGENSSWQLGAPNTPNMMDAYSGVNAWVTNPNGPYNDDEHSYLESPCFDLTGLISPAIEFGMIYYIEECCDGVKLAYSVDGGEWQIVNNTGEFDGEGEMNGDMMNGENYGWYDNENGWTDTQEPFWRFEYAELPELGGQSNVKFRFIFNSDGSVTEDGFAMDDFTILESAYGNDVAPVSLISPSKMNNCDLGIEPLVVDIFNKGLNEVSGFDITFVINYSDTITETVAGPIAPGATLEYTTTTDYDFSSYTYYDVEVYTSLPSDENTMNDFYYEYFNNSPVINTFPYAEDFEAGEGYWTAQGGMESSWEYGTLEGEVIFEDTNFAWVTNSIGLYSPYSNLMLLSPCMDISSIQNPAISFDMWTDIPDANDGVALQYSVDNGMTWHNLGTAMDDDWYNESFTDNQGNRQDYFSGITGGWRTVQHSLIEIPDLSNVRLRFNFGSDGQLQGEGVAIDKINIFEETVYPLAFARNDEEVYLEETVYLDGSLSEDAYGGDNFSFGWESLDGITLLDDTTLQPYFKPENANVTYGFVLTVTDIANGTVARDTVSVSVLPTPGPVHFTDIIWSGEPNSPMEFEIIKATAFGELLEPNDEIALFDGESMVAASLIKRRFILGPLFMTASMDDAGTGALDGFIEGNSISAKVWDASEGKEYDAVIILYKPGSNTVYTQDGHAKAELLVDEAKQSIALAEGWNIMSINVRPYTRLIDSLFAPLRINESLVKVQDESGYSYEYIMSQWLNSMDLHKYSEGYKVRVNNSAEFEVTGKHIDLPVSINLKKGWNIMGYPVSTPQSAELILSYLINNDILVKVQDETGASIESVSPIGWVNNIGNLQPGKGYKIKVQIPSQITIDSAFYKSTRIIRKNELSPVRFSTVWTGNGLDHMNVYVNELLVDGEQAVTGTEIAVFDGEKCVGAGVYNRTFDYLTFTVSKDDPFTEATDGYTTGNNLAFKVYDPNTGELVEDAVVTYVNEDASTTFEPSATTVVNIRANTGATGVSDVSGLTASLGENYPNPFAEETFFNYTIAKEGNVRVEIIDLLGKRVRTLIDRRMAPGHYTVKWNRMDEEGERVTEGIYLYRLRTDDRSFVNRMIVIE